MATAVEQLAEVATSRQKEVESDIRELRAEQAKTNEGVVKLRLALARRDGADGTWGKVQPWLSLLVSIAALVAAILLRA